MLHTNGPSSSTAALINAFIDSDDEPLYDKVASDEDYSSLPNNEQQQQQKRNKVNKKTKKVFRIFRLKKKIKIRVFLFQLSTLDSSKEHFVDGLLQSPSEVNKFIDSNLRKKTNIFLEYEFFGNIK